MLLKKQTDTLTVIDLDYSAKIACKESIDQLDQILIADAKWDETQRRKQQRYGVLILVCFELVRVAEEDVGAGEAIGLKIRDLIRTVSPSFHLSANNQSSTTRSHSKQTRISADLRHDRYRSPRNNYLGILQAQATSCSIPYVTNAYEAHSARRRADRRPICGLVIVEKIEYTQKWSPLNSGHLLNRIESA